MSGAPLDLWTGMWAQNGAAGRLIVAFILALAIPGALVALRQIHRYGSELAYLARAETNLANWHAEDSGAAEVEEGAAEDQTGAGQAPPPRIEELVAGIAPKSLVAIRLEALEKMLGARVRVNLETLQQLTLARDAAQGGSGLPQFAGSTAMLLGILGTFVGLAAMVRQIDLGLPGHGVPGMESWSQSVANLRQVLGGMRTAFSTSLVGMSAAVSCFALDFWTGRRRSRFYERLERFTIEDLLPATAPVLADESLLERVTVQLERSFDRLDAIFVSNEHVLRHLTGAEQAFAAVVDELRSVTNSDARQDLRQVIANLDKTSRSFLELSAHLPSIVHAVERGSGKVTMRLDSFLRRWFPAAVFLIVVCVWLALALVR